MIKTRTWMILLTAVIIICSAISFFIFNGRKDLSVVYIEQNGVLYEEIDLSKVTSSYDITIESEDGGMNVISVSPGSIRVSEADCPDRVCVMHGSLPGNAAPIVCMPHKLMIRMADTSSLEADITAQ